MLTSKALVILNVINVKYVDVDTQYYAFEDGFNFNEVGYFSIPK